MSETDKFNKQPYPGSKNGKKDGNGHSHHDQAADAVVIGETEDEMLLHCADFLAKYDLNHGPVNKEAIKSAVTQILNAVGEDPEREGLQMTPRRVANAYEELLQGYRTDPAKLINNAIFDVEYDDMVIVRDIEYFSLCEHHMLPFMGHAHVAYIPGEKVIGLSKIPRIVDMFSRRLQVQERLTRQIASFIEEVLGAKGVAVIMDGMHMCSMMRGVKKCDSGMTTSAFLGEFKTNKDVRAELMAHLERSSGKPRF